MLCCLSGLPSFSQTPIFASLYYCENIYCREIHLVLYSDSTVIYSRGKQNDPVLYKAKLSKSEFDSVTSIINKNKSEIYKSKDKYPSTGPGHCGSEILALFEGNEKVISYCRYNAFEPAPSILLEIKTKMENFTPANSVKWHPDSLRVQFYNYEKVKDDKKGWPKEFPPIEKIVIRETPTAKNSPYAYFPYSYLPVLQKYYDKHKRITVNGWNSFFTFTKPFPYEDLLVKLLSSTKK